MQKLIILITERISQFIRSNDPGTSAIVPIRLPKGKPFSAVALGPIDLWWRVREWQETWSGYLVGYGVGGSSIYLLARPAHVQLNWCLFTCALFRSLSLSFSEENSFCGLNIPQKFHSRSGRHFKTVYTVCPGAVRGVLERKWKKKVPRQRKLAHCAGLFAPSSRRCRSPKELP